MITRLMAAYLKSDNHQVHIGPLPFNSVSPWLRLWKEVANVPLPIVMQFAMTGHRTIPERVVATL